MTSPAAGVYRTPDSRFDGLPDFDFEPRYRFVEGLRIAHVEAGEGPPVVMLHGSPAWSFVWRKLIPPLRDSGFRCLALDHAGYGRSDKPLDSAWYSVERHVSITASLFEELDLRDATLVVHDWGGPIGLTLALAMPERVGRIVLLDTAVDPDEVWMNESWVRLRQFIAGTERLPVGELMRSTCAHDPGEGVVAAYQAPFPTPESAASLRGMMLSVPLQGDPAAVGVTARFYARLRNDARPMLILWADSDLFLTLASGERLAARIGRTIDHVIPNAGHGLQEDQGPLIGSLIADWLRA